MVVHTNHNIARDYHKLLATAVIHVRSDERFCDVVAIFEDSKASFISESVAQKLKLKRRSVNLK